MSDDDALAFLQETGDHTDMLMQLLFQVVERTGNYREGFYSLRKVMDLGEGMRKQVSPDITMEEMVALMSNVNGAIQAEIERLDA